MSEKPKPETAESLLDKIEQGGWPAPKEVKLFKALREELGAMRTLIRLKTACLESAENELRTALDECMGLYEEKP